MTFEDFMFGATGNRPYPWQSSVASQGLPETLEIPTGLGKTAGVILAWLYRRTRHPDSAVRSATPRRLIFTLPMRSLVEQTAQQVERWLNNLELADQVQAVTMMGGEPEMRGWMTFPERDSIVIATQDMVISSALNRSFATSRFTWPIAFGVFNNDCHFVFDEVQLMGPARASSRQLQALRNQMGTATPTSCTWMSATLHAASLRTVDAPEVPEPVRISNGDREIAALRIDAARRIEPWIRGDRPDKNAIDRARADAILEAHEPGTRSLVVCNTVAAAQALYTTLQRQRVECQLVLLHSRFRPNDRRAAMEQAAADPIGAGTIVVATQVVEAGIDLSSARLFTEVAPWSAITQRCGRCNRAGEFDDAVVYYDRPGSAAPYADGDIDAAEAVLDSIAGMRLTTEQMSAMDVRETQAEGLVLRRRDLMSLFDTAPDLAGNDIDVAPFIREGDDRDVFVAWRTIPRKAGSTNGNPTFEGPDSNEMPPARDERCAVPIGEVKKWLQGGVSAWRLDPLGGTTRKQPNPWVKCQHFEVRPNQIIIVDESSGGYSAERGWDRKIRTPVDVVAIEEEDQASSDTFTGSDPASITSHPIELGRHLLDVERETARLFDAVRPVGCPTKQVAAAILAGRLHDLGKAHPVFQNSMYAIAGQSIPSDDPNLSPDAQSGLNRPFLAKSGGKGRLRHERPVFRHELASALALFGAASHLLGETEERDLVCYLVAAHHGRIRMAIRPFPNERRPDTNADAGDAAGDEQADNRRRYAAGVWDGDVIPEFTFDGQTVPATTLSLMPMEISGDESGRSWGEMTANLLSRPDLGPFRLGFFESIVRAADWRISASYDLEVSK